MAIAHVGVLCYDILRRDQIIADGHRKYVEKSYLRKR